MYKFQAWSFLLREDKILSVLAVQMKKNEKYKNIEKVTYSRLHNLFKIRIKTQHLGYRIGLHPQAKEYGDVN